MADIVILTALKEEEDALLKYIDSPQQTRENGQIIHRATIPINKSTQSYQVVMRSLAGMGSVQAASATTQAIATWKPSALILVGIAGGVYKEKERFLGDVLIADQIVYYEAGKQTADGMTPRYQVYRGDLKLLEAARYLANQNWSSIIKCPRPDGTTGRITPHAHFGVVMSGEKVIADADFIAKLKSDWPQMLGIEMEGAGAATAAYNSGASGILLVKAICDWADSEKDDRWHQYAGEAAAAFAVELLKTGPIEVQAPSRQTVSQSATPIDKQPQGGNKLSPSQIKRLEQRRKELTQQTDLLSKKMELLKNSQMTAVDPQVQFKLENDITQAEEAREKYWSELEEIERQLSGGEPQSEGAQSATAPAKQYSGKVKIQICKNLTNDWADLADYFDIAVADRSRFEKGREPQAVWEWLETRGKLGELETALTDIGRDDLAAILASDK